MIYQQAVGNFQFTGQVAGLGLADFVLGRTNGFTLGSITNAFVHSNYIGSYVQDAWRITPRVTLNAGLRWNPYFPPYAVLPMFGHFDKDRFDRGLRSTTFPNGPAGMIFQGDPEFAFELGRRGAAAGLDLHSVAAHPGIARTNLQAAGPGMDGNRLRQAVIVGGTHLIGQSDAQGALPSLYAATVPDLPSGTYVGPNGLFEGRGHPKLVSASKTAHDEATARRLWEVSEELTGVSYL